MSETVDDRETALIFKALGHPSRVQIIRELLGGEKCVLEIKELVSISQPNISQHLTILKNAGLVDFKQRGNLRCYYLVDLGKVKVLIDTVS